jgi:hypothetical protein
MLSFLCLFALAQSRLMMVDEVYPIPAGEWHFFRIDLEQRPATVTARYDAPTGAGHIRMALVSRNEYAIVLDNQLGDGKTPMVRLRVWLDFGVPAGPNATTLSPPRRLAVFAISCAVFFAIVFFAGRKLLAAFAARGAGHS